jgi:hypothetical protein
MLELYLYWNESNSIGVRTPRRAKNGGELPT